MLISLHAKRAHSCPRVVGLLLPVVLVAAWAALPAPTSAAGLGAGSPGEYGQAFGQNFSELIAAVPQARINSEPKAKAQQGLELIGKHRLEEGSALLNSALQLDPTNSYLQFFNAFAYHMMAQRGDTQKYSLAEQGYALAVQFDRSNWIAHYYMGIMHFEQRNYRAAQNDLAEVLLFREDDQEVLSRMVAASYYAGDPVTAAACLDRLHTLNPGDAQTLRLLAIVSAAMGRPGDAQRWLAQFQATNPDAVELTSTQERINHWSVVYRNAPVKPLASADDNNVAKMVAPPPNMSASGFNRTEAADGNMMAVQYTAPPFPAAQPSPYPADTGAAGKPGSNNMVLVDVVLMYTVDTLSTNKGVNLLNTLTLQFGSSYAPAFSKAFASTDTSGAVSATTLLTRAITVPALTYSLNIANSNSNLNEVLARPTLAALNGQRSDFFSGETLNAAVVSTNTTTGNSVQIEKEIGVKLGITPTFLPDGKIRLSVVAERTFLKPPSANVGFTYKISVTKVMVNANVEMNFGETLVLGGLNEKETTNMRDGVPFLQDIPGLQYLFSNKNTSNYQHSVLMLITPRTPQYTFRSDAAMVSESGGNADVESMKELRARYGDWFAPYPNMTSVFNQLNSSSIYREFRTGDVTLEKWDKQMTTMQRLKQALGFLFY